MAGPLAGIRVLDVSTIFMGPFACQIMGDLGADVIKVEAPGGDSVRNVGPARHRDMAGMFLNANRSKRALLLDMSKPEGQEALGRLAKNADILVHNIRPRPAAKLGLTYERLSALNPALIFCTAVGYGSDGPYRDRAAYDDLIQGASGVADLIARHQGGTPDYVPMAMADKVSGLVVLSSVLAALFHRQRTGEGQAIEVPMFETISAFSIIDHLNGLAFEPPMGRSGYARQLSPYRHPFKTEDGYVCALPFSDRNWRDYFAIAGRPEFADDPRFADVASRTENTADLYQLLEELMLTKTTAEWLDALNAADIPCGPVNSLDDLLDDPHIKQVGLFQLHDHPTEGQLRFVRLPMKFSKTPPEITRMPPNIGEHSADILAEAGYTKEEIAALFEAGVTGSPD